MTRFTTIAAVALVALLLPVAAVAKEANVSGPTALAGAGFFGGELTMADTDEQRPVRINGAQGGYVGFLDLAGDLKVRCVGKGRVRTHETENGTVYMCAGRAGAAMALGSHFKLRGYAQHYRARFPEGVSGTWHGRFRAKGDGDGEGESREQPARELPARERSKAPGEKKGEREKGEPRKEKGEKEKGDGEKDGVPTLAELAAMLAAQKG